MKVRAMLLRIWLAVLSMEMVLAEQIISLDSVDESAAKVSEPKAIRIDPESRVLRDSQNRHVILHGVNVVYKVSPYVPEEDRFDPDELLSMEDI